MLLPSTYGGISKFENYLITFISPTRNLNFGIEIFVLLITCAQSRIIHGKNIIFQRIVILLRKPSPSRISQGFGFHRKFHRLIVSLPGRVELWYGPLVLAILNSAEAYLTETAQLAVYITIKLIVHHANRITSITIRLHGS